MNATDREMRLCWVASVSHDAHEMRRMNVWQPMHSTDLSDLKITMRVGNEIYGPGTHWVETRALV
ncbi:MAG: hypothetical protein EON56_00060 [Alphaproteobacteria bacterium]|nr:MAG: hypothetical protein EON56_00060 [Alphaproteobacteria bacterium]